MRVLLVVISVAFAVWSGLWWVGARATDRDLTAWLEARHAAGWVANFAEIRTRGYPNRYDTTITELELADTGAGLAWTAPFLQVFRLSYQPTHVIAVLPPTQSLAVPGERIDITAADARGSFVFAPGPDWTLERATLTFEAMDLRSDAGWNAKLDQGRLATRPSERVAGAMDIGLVLTGFEPASRAIAEAAALDLAPRRLERVQIDAAVSFDAPWDRRALEDSRPLITALDVNLAKVTWGEAELWAAGEVTLDARGKPTGRMTVKLTNWRAVLRLARTQGLPEVAADAMEAALEVVSRLAGPDETLDVPLRFQTGRVFLGPIPLGEVSFFQLR